MRRDEELLQDILEATERIGAWIKGVGKDQFNTNELLQSAVVHKLTVIGEAARKLAPDFATRHSDIPWADIVGFRNILVHAYFGIDWEVVWTIVSERLPQLNHEVCTILAAERSDSSANQVD
jgi:uncharacterized protein with HEPN domain